jgi:acetyl esterase/lipase
VSVRQWVVTRKIRLEKQPAPVRYRRLQRFLFLTGVRAVKSSFILMGLILAGASVVASSAQRGLMVAAAPPATATATAEHPLTVDSTVGELLDNPPARKVLEHQVPALLDPKIEQGRALSLRSIQPYLPTLLTDAVLRSIDEELSRTPGAVASANPPRPVAPVPQNPRLAFELRTYPLWPDGAPGALGNSPQDIPTLTLVGPEGAPTNGTAVIVAPGGGYQALATGLEGRQVADWFAAHGVVAFVLTYRLASAGYMHPVQLHDAQRAVRWVRSHARDYGISANRIGMIGFSAGGHLTAMTETLFDEGNPQAADPVDRVSSRPDFAVLGYAAIELGERGWRATHIVGPHPDEGTKRQISPALNVTARTPPTFIFHTTTDETVDVDNALVMYRALNAAHIPVEMHVFARGRHGLGFGMTEPTLRIWPTLLESWLAGIGMLSP